MAAASAALIVQQKLPALTNLITVSRARGWSEQGVRWPHRRRADKQFVFRLFAGGAEAIALTIDFDRPLSSYGVSFDNTRFAEH